MVSDTMLDEGMGVELRESDNEGRDCCGVRIGREGSAGAGCARDIASEGFTGERGWRRSLGRSAADGESVGSGGVPRGIEDAQARMPASLPPTQGLREGEATRGWALEQPWEEAR